MYDVPNQEGRLVVVTGANSGTGREAAKRLAGAGAHVVMGVRSPEKGEAAREEILEAHPEARLEVRRLDLADLSSVAAFAERMRNEGRPLDTLVNNAGVMAVPNRTTTTDGFELQLATNFLGPFALTVWLLPLLLEAPEPRTATMGSGAAGFGRIRFEDLQSEKRYSPTAAYAQSKLADLLMARHLAALAERRGWSLRSVAAHPGYTRTNLQTSGPGLGLDKPKRSVLTAELPFLPSQGVEQGAEPLLFAATDAAAGNGAYYGPRGFLGLTGPAGPARLPRRARNATVASRLWSAASDLTGASLGDSPGISAVA